MGIYEETLKKYWGYNTFRPVQLDIIKSVGEGRDTLGLLPTGGGKSITFQVPAMAKSGICLVVTPLIALMKDQVENLKERNIKACTIYSGMKRDEIDTCLTNCIYGEIKFLYISPERLNSEIFKIRFAEMNVNLIAVDEAHCISQWGYDFRPAYLKIAQIRQIQPNVPILALTATATPKVVDDIQEQLQFKEKNIFQKSFERKNLVYWVKDSENKGQDLLRIVKRNSGSGIIYVRNRKKTRTVAELLQAEGLSADYYHAGLSNEQRDYKQSEWKAGRTKVIVSTNAFGMGIDKPDVRYVVHIDLPDSLEAYFQEAGRAGRDEKLSHAIILFNRYDKAKLRQNLQNSFPDICFIRSVYEQVSVFLQIPMSSCKGMSFDFEIGEFISRYKLNAVKTLSALKILEMEGYVELTEDVKIPTKLKFTVNRDDLYKFQVENIKLDAFIKLILRSYTGLFQEYVSIDETILAKRAQCDVETIYKYMSILSKAKILTYIPRREKPQLIFTEDRIEAKYIYISKEHYDFRKRTYEEKIETAIRYAETTQFCRSRLLLEYFGDKNAKNCGECDICKKYRAATPDNTTMTEIMKEITKLLTTQTMPTVELVNLLHCEDSYTLHVLQYMMDNNMVERKDGQFSLIQK